MRDQTKGNIINMRSRVQGKSGRRGQMSKVLLLLVLLLILAAMTGCSKDKAIAGYVGDDSENSQNVTPSGMEKGEEEDEKVAQNEEFLILINKTHPVDGSYKPEDLTSIQYFASDRSEAGRYMRAEAAAQFEALVEGAAKEGYELVMTTAYRSYEFQNTLYTNYVNRYGEAEANTFSAKPGQSEHQSGLAVDVSSPVVSYALSDDFGDTAEGKWMAENAHKYGFILRFPLGKEEITGYQYEPWHLRYVGQPAADEIYEKGITLEEYLGEV